jgi:hypothetical protein
MAPPPTTTKFEAFTVAVMPWVPVSALMAFARATAELQATFSDDSPSLVTLFRS